MANIEWETPQNFFDALNQEFRFTIDVCASEHNAKCARFFSKQHDGLDRNWSNEIVWMNPPYDKDIRKWMRKAHIESQRGATVVCLIQGRSCDTIWWHDYVMRASEIRFIRDRLHFGFNGNYSRANISNIVVVFHPYCQGPPKTMSIDTKGALLAV